MQGILKHLFARVLSTTKPLLAQELEIMLGPMTSIRITGRNGDQFTSHLFDLAALTRFIQAEDGAFKLMQAFAGFYCDAAKTTAGKNRIKQCLAHHFAFAKEELAEIEIYLSGPITVTVAQQYLRINKERL